jgi:hypothetical protein
VDLVKRYLLALRHHWPFIYIALRVLAWESAVPDPEPGSYHYCSGQDSVNVPDQVCARQRSNLSWCSRAFSTISFWQMKLSAKPLRKHVVLITSETNWLDLVVKEMLAQEARDHQTRGSLALYRDKTRSLAVCCSAVVLSAISVLKMFTPPRRARSAALYPKLDSIFVGRTARAFFLSAQTPFV